MRILLAWLGTLALLSEVPGTWGGSVVTLNSDNVLVINGRKVFPLGMSPCPPNYTLTPTGKDALRELREAGTTISRIAQSRNWDSALIAYQQAALDWSAQNDLYAWVNLRELSQFTSTDTNTPAALRSLVDTFKDHPALGVWKNYDEAWWGKVSATNLQNGYEVIRQQDTNHPVQQTHAPRGNVADLQPYNAAADIIAVDIYPVTGSGSASNPPITNTAVSQVGDWTLAMGQVAAGQKEIWVIEQIAFSGTTPPTHTLVFPTFTQSRYMAYQAIIDGARGLMFFGGNVAATLTPEDALLGWNWTFWTNALRSVVQQLGDHSPLAPALVAPNSALPVGFTGTTAPDVEFCVREVPPYLFILACKREGASVNVTFTNLPAWATTGEVLFESPRTVTAASRSFTDSFAPWDVHVYRFSQTSVSASILYPPQSQRNYAGSTAAFRVMADGTGPLSYQWRRNGTNLLDGGNVSGARSSSLALTEITMLDAASYSVIVTGIGSVTSAPVTLSLTNEPPVIAVQPQGQAAFASTITGFNVRAIGSPPLSYRWRRNGVNLADGGNISGATNKTLTLWSASPADAASYDVVVTGFGSVTSAPAVLTVVTQTLLLYEPFNYTNIGSPVTSNTPANWALNGSGDDDLKVTGGSLSYTGLAVSVGNSVTNGGAGQGVRRLLGVGITNGAIYFSGLFRIGDLGFGTWNGQSAQMGALTATLNTTHPLQVMAKSNSPTGYVLGVQKPSGSASFDTVERHAGETLFLVGKYDYSVSPNAASLWINPPASTFGQASEPASGYVRQTSGTDGYTIDRFNMRQNTAASVPAAIQWDELRFGTSWAAVTPVPAPMPTALADGARVPGGPFQFAYTNSYVVNGSVYASTNLTHWAIIGTATETAPGQYQFTDTTATNYSRRYYKLR